MKHESQGMAVLFITERVQCRVSSLMFVFTGCHYIDGLTMQIWWEMNGISLLLPPGGGGTTIGGCRKTYMGLAWSLYARAGLLSERAIVIRSKRVII